MRRANMTNKSAETIYKEISLLTNNEKIIVLSKLMSEVSKDINSALKTNIYDIKGVGKEIWEGIDAQEYVDRERSSWE